MIEGLDFININTSDPYVNPNKSLERILNEYNKHGKLTIGYDFDGTIYDFHNLGASHSQVIVLLKRLKAIGCTLICWTAAKDIEKVKSYIAEKEIPCDGINTDGIYLGYPTRKPFCNALLDDRSGLAQVFGELTKLCEIVEAKQTNGTDTPQYQNSSI